MMTNCTFSTLRERDMDLLFMEAIITDKGFAKSIVETADLPDGDFSVVDVELSRTELELGESDITVIIEIDGHKYGLLIEDKIDAIAMKDQYERYKMRANVAIERGDYEDYRIFMFSPQKYHDANTEAIKYDYYISYEKHQEYFRGKEDLISELRCRQLEAAINKAKSPANVTLNTDVNAFFVQYRSYQKTNFPMLDLRTKETSNGYWARYGVGLGDAYIYHKIKEGFVDFTFPNEAERISVFQEMASWLRKRGIKKLLALKTGNAAALRIEVPKLNMNEAFEETSESDLIDCFDAISEMTELAHFLDISQQIR